MFFEHKNYQILVAINAINFVKKPGPTGLMNSWVSSDISKFRTNTIISQSGLQYYDHIYS